MIKKERDNNFIALLHGSSFLRLEAQWTYTMLYTEYKICASFFIVSVRLIQTIWKAEKDVTQFYF